MKYSHQAVMNIWSILTEYIEPNKVIHGVGFSKKLKVLKMNDGELFLDFFSRIDCQKEVPEEDFIALAVASLPQDLLDGILKEEAMIEKG